MRWLDKWVGKPVCFMLSLVRRFRERGVHTSAVHRPADTIAFLKFAEQGSTVLAWTALSRAIAKVGRERVYFVVFEDNRHILDALDCIPPENILAISTRTLTSFVLDAARAVMALRRVGVDAIIDLEFFARVSAIFSYLTGAGRRVGYHAFTGEGGRRGDLLTHRVPFNPYLHTSQVFALLVDALDSPAGHFPMYDRPAPMSAALPEFTPTPEDLRRTRPLLPAEEARPFRIVLLNPNAGDLMPLRKWPTDRYVELATRLLSQYGDVRVIFTGGPGEASLTQALVSRVRSARCSSVAGKTTLRQFLTVLTLSDLLVTNDSGPSHFAALTRIQVVTLFGPETPALFAAPTPRNQVLWSGIACSPCVSALNHRTSACTNNVCMQRLTVDQVFDAATRSLNREVGARRPAQWPSIERPAAATAETFP